MIIVLVIYLKQLSAQHDIAIVNQSDLFFQIQTAQTGPDTLPSSEWWGRTEEIVHWLRDTVVVSSRDSLIGIGDTIESTAALSYADDTIVIKQRIIQSGVNNVIAYRVSGPGFIHPWTTDLGFHEEHVLIDTTQALIKYKVDTVVGTDILLAIHKKHVYTIDQADFINPNVLNVMSFNIMIIPFNSTNFGERGGSVAQYISPYQDVVVFQEVFIDSIRTYFVTPTMEAEGFAYNSDILNDPSLPHITQFINGGVIIYSKWPIESTAEHVFSTCAGNDCLAAKGIKYVKLNKLGKLYHVFGTHMQAGQGGTFEKYKQYGEARDFIDSMNLPANEPVIFAGDLNTGPTSSGSWSAVIDSINPVIPNPVGHYTSSFKRSNDIYGKIIDHVWISRDHLIPMEAYGAIISIKAIDSVMWGIFDWSNHRTAIGRFEYPGPLQENFVGTLCPEDSLTLSVYAGPSINYQWEKDGQLLNVPNNTLTIDNPTMIDAGIYNCEATYMVIFGSPDDTLTQIFNPDGPDTISNNTLFELAHIAFSATCLSGISTNSLPAIRIYPTISDGLFQLEGEFDIPTQVRIFNSSGKMIFMKLVSTALVLDLSSLASGLYLITYGHGNAIDSNKIFIK